MRIRPMMDPAEARRLDKAKEKDKSPKSVRKEGGEARGDTVSLSGSIDVMKQVKEAGEGVSDVRMDKVEALRDKIGKGEYHVPAEDIADAIIEHVIKNRIQT